MALDPTVQNTSAPIVPAQPAPTAPAPPAVNDTSAPADTGVPGESPSLPAKPIVPPPQAPAPKPNQTMPGNEHATMIGKIFQTIAGGKTTDYANTPEGPVPVKRNLAPGEMARNILGAAFSLLAAGTGGAQAGLQGRQYKQPEDQTIGGMEKGRIQTRERQAQQVFNNKQVADEATLRAHKDAMEQQESMAKTQLYADQDRAAQLNWQEGNFEYNQKIQDAYKQSVLDYETARAFPGSEVMKGADGKELNFYDTGKPGDPGYVSAGQNAKIYLTQHPDAIHGRTNGDSKYNVRGGFNPSTGAYQLIDYPPDQYEMSLAPSYFQAKDSKGNLKFNPDGSPVPNQYAPKDPKTGKRTIPSQNVSAAQAFSWLKDDLTIQDLEARIQDTKAQTRQREEEAGKNEDLTNAQTLYNAGKIDKLDDRQRNALSAEMRADIKQATERANATLTRLNNATKYSNADKPDDDPAVQAAQNANNEAEDDLANAKERYGQLTGDTVGKQIANKLIRTANLGTIKTKTDWDPIDKQITDKTSDPEEIQKARSKVWSALTPAQQAAITGAAPTPTTPAPTTPQMVGGINVPAGATTTMMGHDGKRHFTNAQGTVDLGIVPNQ